jgi:WD40 repeat protein
MISCLAVSPSEESLICSTEVNQLYTITLSSADLGKVSSEAKSRQKISHYLNLCLQGDQAHFEVLSQTFHSSQVTGIDVCTRKPLIATCSLDRSIRIWNYDSW